MEQVVTPQVGPDDDRPTIFQSGTFQSNLVSLTAGIAMLSELEKRVVVRPEMGSSDNYRAKVKDLTLSSWRTVRSTDARAPYYSPGLGNSGQQSADIAVSETIAAK